MLDPIPEGPGWRIGSIRQLAMISLTCVSLRADTTRVLPGTSQRPFASSPPQQHQTHRCRPRPAPSASRWSARKTPARRLDEAIRAADLAAFERREAQAQWEAERTERDRYWCHTWKRVEGPSAADWRPDF